MTRYTTVGQNWIKQKSLNIFKKLYTLFEGLGIKISKLIFYFINDYREKKIIKTR